MSKFNLDGMNIQRKTALDAGLMDADVSLSRAHVIR